MRGNLPPRQASPKGPALARSVGDPGGRFRRWLWKGGDPDGAPEGAAAGEGGHGGEEGCHLPWSSPEVGWWRSGPGRGANPCSVRNPCVVAVGREGLREFGGTWGGWKIFISRLQNRIKFPYYVPISPLYILVYQFNGGSFILW